MRLMPRLAVAIIATLALSACWVSAVPLITGADAEMPDVEGKWRNEYGDWYEVKANKSGNSFAVTNWSESTPDKILSKTFSFDQVQGDWYIIQSVTDALQGYEIAYIRNGKIERYAPGCGYEITSISGVIVDDSGDCKFSNLEALEKAAAKEIERFDRDNVYPSSPYIRQ